MSSVPGGRHIPDPPGIVPGGGDPRRDRREPGARVPGIFSACCGSAGGRAGPWAAGPGRRRG